MKLYLLYLLSCGVFVFIPTLPSNATSIPSHRFLLRWLPVLLPPSSKAPKKSRRPPDPVPSAPGATGVVAGAAAADDVTTPSLRLTAPFLDVCLSTLTLKCVSVKVEVGGGGVAPGTFRLAVAFDAGTLFVRGDGVTYTIASVGAPDVKTVAGWWCGCMLWPCAREGAGAGARVGWGVVEQLQPVSNDSPHPPSLPLGVR
jgi:hypothetical protein